LIKSKNSEKKITNHLQQDVVKVSGKTIFINPFLGALKHPLTVKVS